MKEFDFEELDRAVSSVLGTSVAEPVDSKPKNQTVPKDDSSVASAAAVSVVGTESSTRTASAVPRRPESSSSGRPTSGRSMDIVRNSSVKPPRPTLESVSADSDTVVTSTAPVENEPSKNTADTLVKSASSNRRSVPMNDFSIIRRPSSPAPASTDQTQREERPVVASDNLADAVADFKTTDPDELAFAPESPFLPDAKVEKRPLGASEPTGIASAVDDVVNVGEETLGAEAASSIDASAVEAIDSKIEDTSGVGESAFDFDIDKLEAESVPEFVDSAVGMGQDSELSNGSEVKDEVAVDSASSNFPTSEVIVKSPKVPESINSQYTPKPSENQESGEIFDTESYHQPFAAQPKKNSGLKITLIILLIVLLAAAAGAGFYFYVLPML